MSLYRNTLVAACALIFCLPAPAADLTFATNAELLAMYLESEDAEQEERSIRNWIDGYVNGFESAYRLEMASSEEDIGRRRSCVSKHDADVLYLMLITAGAKESLKELLVVDTMYLMLRFGCQKNADIGELPSWVIDGGYDELGAQIPEAD